MRFGDVMEMDLLFSIEEELVGPVQGKTLNLRQRLMGTWCSSYSCE